MQAPLATLSIQSDLMNCMYHPDRLIQTVGPGCTTLVKAVSSLPGLLTSFYDILRGFIRIFLEVVYKELTELRDLFLEVCSPGP